MDLPSGYDDEVLWCAIEGTYLCEISTGIDRPYSLSDLGEHRKALAASLLRMVDSGVVRVTMRNWGHSQDLTDPIGTADLSQLLDQDGSWEVEPGPLLYFEATSAGEELRRATPPR